MRIKSVKEQNAVNKGITVEVPSINLENFEDPRFQDSKYVLSSPRSLQACSRLGIKPITLLHKSLLEFEEELLPTHLPLPSAIDMFEEHERERINMVSLCQEERRRIMSDDDDEDDDNSAAESEPVALRRYQTQRSTAALTKTRTLSQGTKHVSNAKSSTTTPRSLLTRKRSSSAHEGRRKERARTRRKKVTIKTPVENRNDDQPIGSLQRQRTAWTTSLGHQRVSLQEVNQRAKEQILRSQRLHEQLQGNHISRAEKRRERVVQPVKQTSARLRKRQERSLDSPDNNGISHSTSDVSSIASSSRSGRWTKDPMEDAAPITNPALRNKLQGVRDVKVTGRMKMGPDRRRSMPIVKAADQKILELMLRKHEGERAVNARGEAARAEAEKQRQAREQNAADKRRTLMEERRRKELNRAHSDVSASKSLGVRRCYSASDTGLNHVCHRDHGGSRTNLEAGLRRKTSEITGSRPDRLDDCCNCDRDKDGAVLRRMEQKQRELEEKRRRSLDRKKVVEKRLEEQRKLQEEEAKLLEEKQKRSVRRVASMKEERDKEFLQKTKLKNLLTQKRHTERLKQMQQQEEEDRHMLQAAIEEKERVAEQKVEELHKKKEHDMHKSHRSLESRLERAKRLQKQREHELEEWKNDLQLYRKLQEQKAEELSKMSLEQKKQRAAEERRLHEKLVKHNMERMMEQEEEWKADVEATIAMKDARSKMLQMEKEEMIQKSRELAQSSQKLREELRAHYALNDIEQLSKQAELEQKILLRTEHR